MAGHLASVLFPGTICAGKVGQDLCVAAGRRISPCRFLCRLRLPTVQVLRHSLSVSNQWVAQGCKVWFLFLVSIMWHCCRPGLGFAPPGLQSKSRASPYPACRIKTRFRHTRMPRASPHPSFSVAVGCQRPSQLVLLPGKVLRRMSVQGHCWR